MPNTLILILYPARNCIQKKWKISRNHWNFTCHYIDDSQLLQKNPLNVSSILLVMKIKFSKQELRFRNCILMLKRKKDQIKQVQSRTDSKVAAQKWFSCIFLKKRLQRRCFPVGIAKFVFLGTAFFIEQLRWVLLRRDFFIHMIVYSKPKLQNGIASSQIIFAKV